MTPRPTGGPTARGQVRAPPGPAGTGRDRQGRWGQPVPTQAAGAPRGPRWILAMPMFWLTVVLLAIGGWRLYTLLDDGFLRYPVASLTAVCLFALYAVPFVVFIRRVDYLHREPPHLFVLALAWGGVVATAVSIAGATALTNLMAKLVSPRFAGEWGPALAASSIEETAKLLGIVAIVLFARPKITSVVNGFVLGALIGLGFQVVEDVLYAVGAVAQAGSGDQVGPVVATFFLRGFLGGLWSHTMFTALAGAGTAYLIVHRDRPLGRRVMIAAACICGAWTCHFLLNSPLLADGLGYGVVGVIIGILIKGIPVLVLVLALVRLAGRHEATYYSGVLAGLGDPTMATPMEIATLVSPTRRLAARRRATAKLGWRGGRAVRRLQRAQARLAVALSQDPHREVLRRRTEVLVRRHELLALTVRHAQSPRRRRLALDRRAVVTVRTVLAALMVIGIGLAIRAIGAS